MKNIPLYPKIYKVSKNNWMNPKIKWLKEIVYIYINGDSIP